MNVNNIHINHINIKLMKKLFINILRCMSKFWHAYYFFTIIYEKLCINIFNIELLMDGN